MFSKCCWMNDRRLVNFYYIRKDEKKTCFQSEQKYESIFDSVKFCPWSKMSERKRIFREESQGWSLTASNPAVSAKSKQARGTCCFIEKAIDQNELKVMFYIWASLVAQQWRICLQHRRCRRCGFNPWVRKIPWRKAWQFTPVLLPRESHGQRSLVG